MRIRTPQIDWTGTATKAREMAKFVYDVWGNIMFGYLGKAAGFDEGELLDGAGVEQIGSSIGSAAARLDPSLLPKPTSGAVWPRAWDDPADQVGSQLGFELWDTYDLTITPMDLIEAIKRSPGLTTYPP